MSETAETTDADGTDGASASDNAEPSVETRGPPIPEAAYTVINPLVSLLLRSPLHGLVSDALMVLRFTGRKTGTEYATPVGYWVRDGALVVTTQSPWWHNLRGGQPVSMHLRGEWREGVATPHPEPAAVAEYMETFIERNGVDAANRLGIRVRGDRAPTRAELEAGVDGTVVITIEPTDGGSFTE